MKTVGVPVWVTEHAVDRWLERVDSTAGRDEVRETILRRLPFAEHVPRERGRGKLYKLPGSPDAAIVVLEEKRGWTVVTVGGWEDVPARQRRELHFYEIDEDAKREIDAQSHVPRERFDRLQQTCDRLGEELDAAKRELELATREKVKLKTTAERALANLKVQTMELERRNKECERLGRELAQLKSGRAAE